MKRKKTPKGDSVTIYCSAETKRRWKAKAKKAGVSLSSYVHSLVDGKAPGSLRGKRESACRYIIIYVKMIEELLQSNDAKAVRRSVEMLSQIQHQVAKILEN